MKARMYEAWGSRSLPTPDGPLPVEKGDIVVVLVVPRWSDAFAAMQALLSEAEEKQRE